MVNYEFIKGVSFIDKKHRIVGFYISTLVFTFILGGIGQVLCGSFFDKEYHTILSLLMIQMAPTLGVIFISLWSKDKNCFKNMNWCSNKDVKDGLWLVLSFMIPVAIVTIASLIISAYGTTYIPNPYPVNLLVMIVLASVFGCIGEEIGWRGFMQPLFNRRYSIFNSGVFTGVLWGIWHFGKLVSHGVLGYLLFIVLITKFSVIMAWIYLKSNGNMICMVMFHLGVNLSSLFLLTEREGILFYTVACIISTLICLVMVFTDKKGFGGKLLQYERTTKNLS